MNTKIFLELIRKTTALPGDRVSCTFKVQKKRFIKKFTIGQYSLTR
jgi:hypothetical protein